MKEKLLEHLDYARDWLNEAESEFKSGNFIQGELNLSLAQAEIKRAWEESQMNRKIVFMPVQDGIFASEDSFTQEPEDFSWTGSTPTRGRSRFSLLLSGRNSRKKFVSLAAVFLIFILSAVFYPLNLHREEMQAPPILEKPVLDIREIEGYEDAGRYFQLTDSLPFSIAEREIHNTSVINPSVIKLTSFSTLNLDVSTAFAQSPSSEKDF